jgi:formate-dependent nitrite reductase membrane component NrfD
MPLNDFVKQFEATVGVLNAERLWIIVSIVGVIVVMLALENALRERKR